MLYKRKIVEPKTFGEWMNEGVCIGDSAHPTCGPGHQMQVRTCQDGSEADRFPVEKCTGDEKIRTISCAVAGTQLPNCPTKGNWNKRLSNCIADLI